MAVTLTNKAYETIASVLTTELNTLGNGSYSSASGAQGADGTGGPLYGDFELVLGSLNPTSQAVADLWLLPSVDGTNYADVPSSTNAAQPLYVGTFFAATGSAAKRAAIVGVALPTGLWKAVLKNTSGVSFAASGNTVKVRPYNLLST